MDLELLIYNFVLVSKVSLAQDELNSSEDIMMDSKDFLFYKKLVKED